MARYAPERYNPGDGDIDATDIKLLQDTIEGMLQSIPDPGLTFAAFLLPGPNGQSVFTPPSGSTWVGQKGQWTFDANYIYLCVALNTWRRVALSAW